LYLGDVEHATSRATLAVLGISHVLNVTTGPEVGRHEGIECLQLAIRDREDENIAPLFPVAFDFIESCRAAGGRVLVNCMAGRSRSASVVIWYLMRSRGMTLNAAFFHTKRARPIVFPNAGFWAQLQSEEGKLHHGATSETPECYVKLLEARLHGLRPSPERSFRLYCASILENLGPEDPPGCAAAVSNWPDGVGGGGSVEAVLQSSWEHLAAGARGAAVRLLAALRDAGKLTAAEVAEGFEQLLSGTDLDELRLDVPRIDAYLLETFGEAERQGLISAEVARRAVAAATRGSGDGGGNMAVA